MGVNITIERPDTYERLSEWDPGRYQGDREFWDNFAGIEFDMREAEGFPVMDDRMWFRPKDFVAFRDTARGLPANSDRWLLAADLLEANGDYWLYFSY